MAAIARAIAAAMAEGRRLVFTAHEGDTNQREKHRDTKNDNTVHPQILQLLTGTGKREQLSCRLHTAPPRCPTADFEMRLSVPQPRPSRLQVPVVKLC
jgi:hypothetical protein